MSSEKLKYQIKSNLQEIKKVVTEMINVSDMVGGSFGIIYRKCGKTNCWCNKKNQKGIDRINLSKLKKYYNNGHFPDGTMGPKILAAIRFLEYGGEKVIISNVDKAWESINKKIGTHITKT